MSSLIQSIESRQDGESLEAGRNLYLFRVPKFRHRHAQTYALLYNKEMVLIDAVHDITRPAVEELRKNYRIAGILLTHSDLIDQAFGTMDEVAEWAGADIYAHHADHKEQNIKDLSGLQQGPLAEYHIQFRHIPGHTPGSCVYYDPGMGRLFTGDSAVGSAYGSADTGFTHPPVEEEQWPAFKDGWENVNFNVVEVYPLHGKPATEGIDLEELKKNMQDPGRVMS
ncbi:MAG: MBL fold metallo-hydrolase [Cyclobacteriaceae bacterium]